VKTTRFFTLLSLLLLVVSAKSAISSDSEQEEYTMVWYDEFDVDGTPGEHWDYERGFVRNSELQWYQPANATVKDGCLVIEGRKETVVNDSYEEGSRDWRKARKHAEYTSSSLTTKKSFHFKYGRMEVRAKIPTASGSWPAIWLLGNQWGWPSCGEVDVMEYYLSNKVPSVLANACWAGEKGRSPRWDTVIAPLSHFTQTDPQWVTKFHVWRMDWDELFIKLYLDDELMNTIDLSLTTNASGPAKGKNPFSNDIADFGMYILLNLAIGQSGGIPDDSQFPLQYYIDYVRVYSRDGKSGQTVSNNDIIQ